MIDLLDNHAGNVLAAKAKEQGKVALRASTISNYMRCPHQFFLKYIKPNYMAAGEVAFADRQSAAAALGTTIHKAMEVGLIHKRDIGQPTYEMMLEAAREEWNFLNMKPGSRTHYDYAISKIKPLTGEDVYTPEEQRKLFSRAYMDKYKIITDDKTSPLWFNTGKGENQEEMYMQIDELVRRYHGTFIPLIKPVYLERVLTKELDNPVFAFMQGSIDVEEERGVRDLKITGRKTVGSSHAVQLSVYSLLRKAQGLENDYGVIDNIIKNKSVTNAVMQVELKEIYTQRIIDEILEKARQWHETRDDSIWHGSDPINNFLCNSTWCSAFSTCPHVAGWDDVASIDEVEI